MQYPLVTIAIPTHNRLNYLKEAIQCALAQTYSNFNILVGQDSLPSGPNQEIKAWLERISKENPKVTFFTNERNLGMAGNYNACINQAIGEYLVLIDDDDRLKPDFLKKLVTIATDTNADVVFCNQYFIDSEGIVLERITRENTSYYKRDELVAGVVKDPLIAVWKNSVPLSASLFKLSAIRKISFKEYLTAPEIEMYLQMALKGNLFAFTKEYLADYRLHTNSATGAGINSHTLLKDLIKLDMPAKYEKYKHEFIASQMTHAVNMAILRNNKSLGRELHKSKYYPKSNNKIKFLLQSLLLNMPDMVSSYILNKRGKLSI